MKKQLRTIDYIIITYIILQLIYFWIYKSIEHKETDKEYIEMHEINHNKSIVGMTTDEVVEQLGEPMDISNDRDERTIYKYSAGRRFEKTITGNIYNAEYYELVVLFDENDQVEYTYIKQSP